MDFDIKTLAIALIPMLVAFVSWLGASIFEHETKIEVLEKKMHTLVTDTGEIIPSPMIALDRQLLKEDLMAKIHKLDSRLNLLEEHERIEERERGK